MTLVASGDLYIMGSAGTGATRSIAYEVDGGYTTPVFFSDLLNDACSLPIAFAGDQVTDFYGHTQSRKPHDPVVVSLDWIGILDQVTIDWSHGSNACETPTGVHVYKSINGGVFSFEQSVTNPTSILVFTQVWGGDPTDTIQIKLVSYNTPYGTAGADVLSSTETVQ